MNNNFIVQYPPQYGIVKSALDSNGEFKGSLFHDVYCGCKKSVESIIKSNLECDNNNVMDPFINPIIAITGSRGSGKSSVMVSFAEYLKNATINGATFSVLPFIDATQFGKNESVVGNIAAIMYREYGYISDQLSVDKKRNFVKLAKEVNNTAVMYSTGEWFKCGDDLLQDSEMVGNLKNRLHKLITVYLNLKNESDLGNRYLVLMLDDLDMCNEGAYAIVEEIRKFLCVRNVIILMTMKSDQLRTVLKASYSKAFRGADDEFLPELRNISQDLAFRSFEKLFPIARCHLMPVFDDEKLKQTELSIVHKVNNEYVDIYGENINKPTDYLFKKIKALDKTKTLYRTLHLIWRKTLMIPVCDKNGEHLLIPNNLRSLHNFIAMLNGMEEVIQVDKITGDEFPTFIPGFEGFESWGDEGHNYIDKEILKNNLTVFENYLMDNLSSYDDSFTNNYENQTLIQTLRNLIYELKFVPLERLNAKIVGDILDSKLPHNIDYALGGSENNDSEYCILKEAATHDDSISVGDVIYVFGKISSKTRCRYISCLVEIIRTLWSVRMTREFYLNCTCNSRELKVSKAFRKVVGGLIVNANAVSFTKRKNDGDWYEVSALNPYISERFYIASYNELDTNLLSTCKKYRAQNSLGKPYYEEKDRGLNNHVYHPLAGYTNELGSSDSEVLYFPFYSLDFLSLFYDKFREVIIAKEYKSQCDIFIEVLVFLNNAKLTAYKNITELLNTYIPYDENNQHSIMKKEFDLILKSIVLPSDYNDLKAINELLEKCSVLKYIINDLGDRGLIRKFDDFHSTLDALNNENEMETRKLHFDELKTSDFAKYIQASSYKLNKNEDDTI